MEIEKERKFLKRFFDESDLKEIISKIHKRVPVDICSKCKKSTSKRWPCTFDCEGLREILLKEVSLQ